MITAGPVEMDSQRKMSRRHAPLCSIIIRPPSNGVVSICGVVDLCRHARAGKRIPGEWRPRLACGLPHGLQLRRFLLRALSNFLRPPTKSPTRAAQLDDDCSPALASGCARPHTTFGILPPRLIDGQDTMVLHLLGKKGWNVYNADNVARVRADEAAAQARDEAREQRMQEEDAARRLAILRGERPPELTVEEEEPTPLPPARGSGSDAVQDRPRKRRRMRGEDDTDAEIRHARQDVAAGERARSTLATAGNQHEDAPLLDHAGHLQLIPAPDEKAIRKAEKSADDAKKRKREVEQYQMRFDNAAGFHSSVGQKPWYAAAAASQDAPSGDSKQVIVAETQGKDVWGNEDPLRKERERNRISKSDPFAAMQQAQRQLKQSERDREQWQRERDTEMEAVRKAEKRARRERKRGRRDGEDGLEGLEGFSLDAPAAMEERRGDRRGSRHSHHRHRRRRSRSRSRSRDRRPS